MPLATQPSTKRDAVKNAQLYGSLELATPASQDAASRKKKPPRRDLDDSLAAGSNWVAFVGTVDVDISSIDQAIQGFTWVNIDRVLDLLNGIAQLHPIIQVTVGIFAGAIKLVRDVLKNDRRLKLLVRAMCDMMECLKGLKRFKEPVVPVSTHLGMSTGDLYQQVDPSVDYPGGKAGRSEETALLDLDQDSYNRISSRLVEIQDSIKVCTNVCMTFRKEPFLVRVAHVYRWQARFEGAMQLLEKHKQELQFDLQIHVANASEEMRKSMALMAQCCLYGPAYESTAFSAIREAGGPEPGGQEEYENGARMLGRDDKAFEKLRLQLSLPDSEDPLPSRTDFMKKFNRTIEDILKSNISTQKQLAQIQTDVEDTASLMKQTHGLVSVLADGPYTRIVDKDVQKIWKYMGWKGSVKSRNLVVALRDYFSHPVIYCTEEEMKAIASTPQDGRSETEINDMWALRHITVTRMQPLLEAVDDDCSSFVTISEINQFTKSKPKDWSMPLWMAYWAYGFELSSRSYFRLIRAALHQLWQASRTVHPPHRPAVSSFVQCGAMWWLQDVLSGFTGIDQSDTTDTWDPQVAIFNKYTNDLEIAMENVLRDDFHYQLDRDALATIVKGGRPETYFLPIVFILVKHSVRVVLKAQETTFDSDSLDVISKSLEVVLDTVSERARELQAHWKLNGLDEAVQLDRFFFGFYSYVTRDSRPGSYWSLATTDLEPVVQLEDTSSENLESSETPATLDSEHRDTTPVDPREEEDTSRRSFIHRITCDICKYSISYGRRFTCAECSQALGNDSLDFCHPCYRDREIEALGHDLSSGHQLSHTILEIRTPLLRSFLQSVIAEAREEVENIHAYFPLTAATGEMEPELQESRRRTCKECSDTITTMPYWNCTDCRSTWTWFCQACNDKFDHESSKRMDDAPISEDDEHQWWHTLACVRPKSGVGRPPTTIALLEERMEALERQLKEEQSAAAKDRADARAHYSLMTDLLKKFAPAEVVSALDEATAVIPHITLEVVATDLPDVSLSEEGNADEEAATLATDVE